MKKLMPILALAAPLGVALLCLAPGQRNELPEFSKWREKLLLTITNKTISDDTLLESISMLGRVTEPPSFWTTIADDRSYPVKQRTRAVFALFRRHAMWCPDCRELSATLAPAQWLSQSTVSRIEFVFGLLPIDVNEGQSVYQTSVLNGPSIYIKLQGDIAPEAFSELLHAKPGAAVKMNPAIIQCAYSDDYDEWLRGRKGVGH
jgi:hypothetical protein